MTIDVVFSINEYLTGGSTSGVYMEKIYAEDERKALYMNYNSTLSLGDSSADSTHLKLVFGNALNADWSSSNVDVVAYNEGSHLLKSNRCRCRNDHGIVYRRNDNLYRSDEGLCASYLI